MKPAEFDIESHSPRLKAALQRMRGVVPVEATARGVELAGVLAQLQADDDVLLGVTVVSFGYRYGIPAHADVVLDVRFLPNPYFVPELKPFPGSDPRVRDYVMGQPDAGAFLERVADLCGFLLPRYRSEGKSYLTLAVGCTGGRHRSVAIADALATRLRQAGSEVRVWHRDVDKE